MDWLAFLKKYLPQLAGPEVEKLAHLIEQQIGKPAADNLAPAYARLLAKGIDGLAAALAMKVQAGLITADQAKGAMVAYIQTERQAATELGNALEVYAPLAQAVETAKHPPEGTSPEDAAAALKTARAERKAGLAHLRDGARQFLEALAGSN